MGIDSSILALELGENRIKIYGNSKTTQAVLNQLRRILPRLHSEETESWVPLQGIQESDVYFESEQWERFLGSHTQIYEKLVEML